MNEILADCEGLAAFSNLELEQVDEFRHSRFPNFVPDELWSGMLGITIDSLGPLQTGKTTPVSQGAWLLIRDDLRSAWSKKFPRDLSIKLITQVSDLSRLINQVEMQAKLGRGEPIDITKLAPEIWPFQQAVMCLAVEFWRARYCPECGKRFVAAKPKSKFCTIECFKKARRDYKRGQWQEHGAKWGKSRAKSTRKRKKSQERLRP